MRRVETITAAACAVVAVRITAAKPQVGGVEQARADAGAGGRRAVPKPARRHRAAVPVDEQQLLGPTVFGPVAARASSHSTASIANSTAEATANAAPRAPPASG
jgi:hypothetical protein